VKKPIVPLLGAALLFYGLVTVATPGAADKESEKGAGEAADAWVLPGQTQCINNRRGIIAPTVLHPVTEVMVAVGDKVKKGQPLVQIDDDEPQAEVRAKKAQLESAANALREAQRYLSSLESLHNQGAVPVQKLYELRAAAIKAEADEKFAKASLDAHTAELEHYVVIAPIDGIVNRLEVHPGMVSRPGTSVWGEILDLREIDVRFQVTLDQADLLKVGDLVEVLRADLTTAYGTGKVVFIGLEANAETGKVPALVRLANPEGKLRCEAPVRLRFPANQKKRAGRPRPN
jgi:RND family efflux transporter MFP subunit